MTSERELMVLPINEYEAAGKGYLTPTPHRVNNYTCDEDLQAILRRVVPASVLQHMEKDGFVPIGEKTKDVYYDMSVRMEREKPSLLQYNAYGHRVDQLLVSQTWSAMKSVSAVEGLIHFGYTNLLSNDSNSNKNNNHNHNHNHRNSTLSAMDEFARFYQYTKYLLWLPTSGLYGCPLAMTDGAAKLLYLFLTASPSETSNFNEKTKKQYGHILQEAYDRLTSRDPKYFWTSGQWMTERGGGSDVSHNGTRTIAKLQTDGTYRLFGFKWFSSATDADMAITLARIEDDNGVIIPGNKGIACFFLKVRNEDGTLNNIRIAQLKDKFGTRQLPTAELELYGTKALMLSKLGRGIPAIMEMANITRIHNSLSSVSTLQDVLLRSREFAKQRKAFNQLLANNILYQQTLTSISVLYRACLSLVMDEILLLVKSERSESFTERTNATIFLRLLTPIIKMYTARCAVAAASEGIENFGGIGYLETSDMPRILRDAQVLTIWEGTTNLLSVDTLSVLQHQDYGAQSWKMFTSKIRERLQKGSSSAVGKSLKQEIESIEQGVKTVEKLLKVYGQKRNVMTFLARDFTYSLARIYAASLLLEHVVWSKNDLDITVFQKYVNGNFQSSHCGSPTLVARCIQQFLENNPSDSNLEKEIQSAKKLGMGSAYATSSKL